MTRHLALVALLLGFLLATGCGTSNKYHVLDRKSTFKSVPLTAVVTDFDDARGEEVSSNTNFGLIPIIGLWGGYSMDRHDAQYPAFTVPFPKLVAEELANRLKEANTFESVTYASPDKLPAVGTYDVLVKGKINRIRAKGGLTRYGLSYIGEYLWDLGPPNRSRYWDIDIDYQLYNAYTNEPIGQPVSAKYVTGRMITNRYAQIGKTDDLRKKIVPASDAFIDGVWTKLPKADDSSWAAVRSEGQRDLARAAREQDLIKKGSPPAFTVLAPAKGEEVRGATTTLRWSVTAPGRLKSIAIVMNNQPVDSGVDAIALSDQDNSPTSLPARDVTVPLRPGKNTLEYLVTDHRGNSSRDKIEIVRLPAKLVPERRYALLVGADSAAAEASAKAVSTALTDPGIGQFKANDVTLVTGPLTAAKFDEALSSFSSKPVSGDLVFVYVAANGAGADAKLGDGTITLQDVATKLSTSLAATDVIFLAEVNAATDGNAISLSSSLKTLPNRWGVALVKGSTKRSSDGQMLMLGRIVSEVLRGQPGSTDRLTLERFFDTLGSRSEVTVETTGRYSPSSTLVERE